ncbi:hypothetical protein [Paraburkholderia atlantica]|uniref:hypothetical protein n=1 Tax=Paraburkholderia atlantica TaxID=2654982 RepID=UPI00161A586F|nr:hypothetical protein [Paraburkholderia atlantica]MBB5419838.1 hypothetical protein [Paraburkholderia atlantica]
MSGHRDKLSEFVLLFMLSGILLVLVATPLPASSAFLHFGIADPNTSATVSEFYPLVPAQGMVSMTSFRTTLVLPLSMRCVACHGYCCLRFRST